MYENMYLSLVYIYVIYRTKLCINIISVTI